MVPYNPLGIFCNQVFIDYAQCENENFCKKLEGISKIIQLSSNLFTCKFKSTEALINPANR